MISRRTQLVTSLRAGGFSVVLWTIGAGGRQGLAGGARRRERQVDPAEQRGGAGARRLAAVVIAFIKHRVHHPQPEATATAPLARRPRLALMVSRRAIASLCHVDLIGSAVPLATSAVGVSLMWTAVPVAASMLGVGSTAKTSALLANTAIWFADIAAGEDRPGERRQPHLTLA